MHQCLLRIYDSHYKLQCLMEKNKNNNNKKIPRNKWLIFPHFSVHVQAFNSNTLRNISRRFKRAKIIIIIIIIMISAQEIWLPGRHWRPIYSNWRP